ncbi:MAG: response regulator [Pseudomonadales bacterium]
MRKAPSIATLFLLLFAVGSSAAPVLNSKSEYLSEPIDNYIDVFFDDSASLTFEKLFEPEHQREFAPLTLDRAEFGFTDAAVWLRMSLRNETPVSDRFSLQFRPINISSLDVFEAPSKTGQAPHKLYSMDDRRPHSLYSVTPGLVVSLGYFQPGELKTIYIRITSEYPINLNAVVFSSASQGVGLAAGNSYNTFLLGGLWAAALLLAACVIYSHEIIFAYGVGYALAVIGYLRSAWGYPAFLVFGEAHYHGKGIYAFGLFMSLFMLLMTRRIILGARVYRGISRLLEFTMFINVCGVVSLLFLDPQGSFYVFYSIHVFSAVMCLIAALPAYTEEHKNYLLLFVIGHAVTLLIIVVNTLTALVDLSTIVLGNQVIGSVTVLMMLVHLVAMALFYNFYREVRLATEYRIAFNADLVSNQTSLLSKLTHEIRTPMAGVLGMTELLRSTQLTETQADFADNIDRSSQELLHIIDDVTAFAHIQNDSLPVQKQPFGLLEMLDELMLAFGPEAERKNIELVMYVEPGQANYIIGDLVRVRHIVGNLLSHCIACLRDGEVLVRASVESENLKLVVQDNGPGISGEELAEFFIEGEELGNLVPRNGGIGLPLSKKIAEALGGILTVSSVLKEGTRFEFTLPVEVSDNPPSAPMNAERLKDLRVLVVDDSGTYCSVIEQQVRHWGTYIDSCMSGSEALALLRAKENIEQAYHVLLVDYAMPGMSGLQLAERIQTDEHIREQNLIIIMLTGVNTAPDLATAYKSGIRRILHKPLGSKALQQVLLEELQLSSDQSGSVAAPAEPDAATLHSIKVLLAEDNDISARVIERMLHRIGVSTQLAVNGEEALLAVQRNRFDLVLMDCEMPVMDGFEATALIRRWEEESGRSRTTVVALTAHLLEQLQDRIHAAGMDDQVSKPLRIHELQSLLGRWVLEFREA